MKLSVLPTVNDLVLSLDRYDQAIADTKAGKLQVIVASQQLAGAALDVCKDAMLVDLTRRRHAVLQDIRACGVEID